MNPIEPVRTGIILNTEHYDACVAFYRNLFGLPLMYEKVDGAFRLTCLALGDSYLMIEMDGIAQAAGKSIAQCPHKLRFNVADIDAALRSVKAFGLHAAIESYSWGRVINVYDPDGNRVGIRDEADFLPVDDAG